MADTAQITASPIAAAATPQATSGRRMPVLVLCAAGFLGLIAVVAIFGSLIAPKDPDSQDLFLNASMPSGSHWLGTDQLGRDVFSRVIVGTSNAVLGPVIVALGTVSVGAALGLVAGYRGGLFDTVASRCADLMYALPGLLVIIVLAGVVGGGYWFAVGILTVLSIPGAFRITRSAALAQVRLPYVEAARTLGLSAPRVLGRHVLPNILPTVVASFLLDIVAALIGLSGLSYLGIGVPPGTPDWGAMLQEGQALLAENPWLTLAPSIMIMLTATSVTLLGDWVYDRFSMAGEHK